MTFTIIIQAIWANVLHKSFLDQCVAQLGTCNDSELIYESTIWAALTYHWYVLPLCLLMHLIMFIKASSEYRLCPYGYPMEVFDDPLGPVPTSSPHPSALLCEFGVLSRVTSRLHRMWASIASPRDIVPTPRPLPGPMPAVPTLASAINISLSDWGTDICLWLVFLIGSTSGALQHKLYNWWN